MSEQPGSERNGRVPKVALVGVTKTYGDVVAVEDATLEVSEGEFLTLLGPSGSGKTTLLLMIAGLVRPTAGEIWLDGTRATQLPPHRRELGMVFQSYALFPHMTVYDNIAFPLRMRGMPEAEIRRRVEDVLQLVQLPDVGGRGTRQLSGGQQQRIALARALVYNPAVLLMDEPLGALDKKLRDHMKLELKQLQVKLGVTVLYVTHDQEEALTLSDRIVVMHRARVQQVGTPEDLYERPAHAFVADFIGESNLLEGKVESERDGRCRVGIEGGAVIVTTALEKGSARAVTVMIRPERIRLLGPEEPTDNVFEAKVEQVLYLGEVIKVWVRLANGQVLEVKQPAGRQGRRPGHGETVRIGWSVEDCVTLPGHRSSEA